MLNQVGTQSSSKVLTLWQDVFDDIYGDDEAIKKERIGVIIEVALNDAMVSLDAKNWLRGLSKF